MKLGNLYNLGSMQAFVDSRYHFNDAEHGIILARQLTHVDPKIYEQKYPEHVFLSSGITVDNTGGYAKIIQSLKLTDQGSFADADDRGGNNGIISLKAEDNFIKVKEYHAESKWSDTEVKEADLQGINLPSRYLATHNKIYLSDIDKAGYLGSKGDGHGLLTYAGFTASSAGGAVSTLTGEQMYDAIATLITDQWDSVVNIKEYKANRVDMPTGVFNRLTKTIMNTAAGPATVISALRANFPEIEFRSTVRANEVDINGIKTSVTVAYCNSSDVMVIRIPQPLEFSAIEQRLFNFEVESKFRVAGLDVLDSLGARRMLGL